MVVTVYKANRRKNVDLDPDDRSEPATFYKLLFPDPVSELMPDGNYRYTDQCLQGRFDP